MRVLRGLGDAYTDKLRQQLATGVDPAFPTKEASAVKQDAEFALQLLSQQPGPEQTDAHNALYLQQQQDAQAFGVQFNPSTGYFENYWNYFGNSPDVLWAPGTPIITSSMPGLSGPRPPSTPQQLAAALQKYQSPTLSTKSTGTPVTAPPPPPIPTPAPAPAPQPVAIATTVQLSNLSRSGGTIFAGDTLMVQVHGAPNQPVTLTVSQNGATPSTVSMGQTDGNGNFSVVSAGKPEYAGSWTEIWKVGGAAAPTLLFSVSPAPAPTPMSAAPEPLAPAPAETPADNLTLLGDQSSTWQSYLPSSVQTAVTDATQFVTGSDLPWWAWVVIAGGGALLLFGGKKR
jgi:hypothetical protein